MRDAFRRKAAAQNGLSDHLSGRQDPRHRRAACMYRRTAPPLCAHVICLLSAPRAFLGTLRSYKLPKPPSNCSKSSVFDVEGSEGALLDTLVRILRK